MRPFSVLSPRIWKALLTCALLLACGGLVGMVKAQGQATTRIYLPMLRGEERIPDQQPPPPPPPPADRGAFFLSTAIANNSADMAVDANGGMHAAYAHFVPTAENPRAVYSFCLGGAAACAQPAAWQSVALGERVREVQLDLTAAGLPRLLIVSDEAQRGGIEHAYAECSASCGAAGSWTITKIVTTYNATDVIDLDEPQRSFAISPQGQPAFVASNRDHLYAEPDKYGTYYYSCATDCANAASWSETILSITYRSTWTFDYEIFRYPVLSFTASGEPRVLTRVFALNEDGSQAPNGLYYYSCAAACDAAASWERLFLLPTGDGATPYPAWDLELLADGRPRVALFTGDNLNPAEYNHSLLYLYCESSCMEGPNWFFNRVLAAQRNGRAANIEADSQGRPRIAWVDESGDLGYAWCNTSCETEAQATWQQQIVEREEDLREEFPQAIPPHCDADVWHGHAPVMALDSAGNPRITYDVAVKARCAYDETPDDPSDPLSYRFEGIWRGVHLAYFPQP